VCVVVGGIEYAQIYGAGSARDAMSERNTLGSRRTNGSESSLPRVRSVRVWAECQQARVASPIRGDKCSTNDRPGTEGPHRTNQGLPERKDLMRTRTKRKVLLGANVGNVSSKSAVCWKEGQYLWWRGSIHHTAIFGVDGSCKDGKMGAGCCRFQGAAADTCTRVGREDEGTSSKRPELKGRVGITNGSS